MKVITANRWRAGLLSRRLLLIAWFWSLVVVLPSAGPAHAATYSGGATIVVKQVGSQALADVGAVVCRPALDTGYGGACIRFGTGNAVRVTDVVAGGAVAFQVCIDNDGNGKCGGTPVIPGCLDQQFYSHNDAGAFFNPLGPLPVGFRSGCPGGVFRGYIVFVCQGVHLDGFTAHTHRATGGTAVLTTGGQGFGNFCGGGSGGGDASVPVDDPRIPPKPYYII